MGRLSLVARWVPSTVEPFDLCSLGKHLPPSYSFLHRSFIIRPLNKNLGGIVLRELPEQEEITEGQILQRAVAGNQSAYGEIFLRHRGRAFALAFQYLHDREDAKDVVQDAFVKAFQNLHKFNLKKKFGPWLLTIVRNLSIDLLRRRKRISPDGLTESLGASLPGGSAEQQVLRGEVWAALLRLSPGQKEIIFLKDYQGHSYLEIAEILKIPLGTVMSRLHHARKNLIAALREIEHDV